jgi:hypothetical protein
LAAWEAVYQKCYGGTEIGRWEEGREGEWVWVCRLNGLAFVNVRVMHFLSLHPQ